MLDIGRRYDLDYDPWRAFIKTRVGNRPSGIALTGSQAVGAPICFVDWSSVARVRPSSQILVTWLPALNVVGPLTLSQKVFASAFWTLTAVLPTLGRVRRTVAAWGAGGVLRRVDGAVRRSGSRSMRASSYPWATRSVRLKSRLSRRPSVSSGYASAGTRVRSPSKLPK